MNTYDITVTEFYEKTIPVEATSIEEAISIASHLWDENAPLLDSPRFKGVKYVAERRD